MINSRKNLSIVFALSVFALSTSYAHANSNITTKALVAKESNNRSAFSNISATISIPDKSPSIEGIHATLTVYNHGNKSILLRDFSYRIGGASLLIIGKNSELIEYPKLQPLSHIDSFTKINPWSTIIPSSKKSITISIEKVRSENKKTLVALSVGKYKISARITLTNKNDDTESLSSDYIPIEITK